VYCTYFKLLLLFVFLGIPQGNTTEAQSLFKGIELFGFDFVDLRSKLDLGSGSTSESDCEEALTGVESTVYHSRTPLMEQQQNAIAFVNQQIRLLNSETVTRQRKEEIFNDFVRLLSWPKEKRALGQNSRAFKYYSFLCFLGAHGLAEIYITSSDRKNDSIAQEAFALLNIAFDSFAERGAEAKAHHYMISVSVTWAFLRIMEEVSQYDFQLPKDKIFALNVLLEADLLGEDSLGEKFIILVTLSELLVKGVPQVRRFPYAYLEKAMAGKVLKRNNDLSTKAVAAVLYAARKATPSYTRNRISGLKSIEKKEYPNLRAKFFRELEALAPQIEVNSGLDMFVRSLRFKR